MEDATKKNIEKWLQGAYDEDSKNAVRDLMQTDMSALEDAFYRDLEFGTGGLRGIMGIGTNRMNKYTVAMATQGLANYIKQEVQEKTPKVAIAYDSRNNSRYFSEIAADVLSANGIYTYIFDDIRPTPELSFAIRHLKCDSGIVITASHNPKEYNGYKAYWSDGGQLVPPHDNNVIAEVRKIQGIENVNLTRNDKLVQYIGKEIDEAYISVLKTLSMNPNLIEKHSRLNIVYSPLHGTGGKIVPEALSAFGFKNVNLVEEQAVADGNFPTVISPNPEESEALSMALKQAKNTDADLVMATDPDSDRVGIAVKNNKGEFVLLNGNMTAALIVYYMCKMWKENNKLTGNEYIIKSIVTSDLLTAISHSHSIPCREVLTGFKYFAEEMRKLENEKTFICGGEESYGYLIGDHARDKDAVIACCIIAEIVAWAKEQQKSLFDVLMDIYLEFGYYRERLFSLTKKGQNGAMEIDQMMKNYRNNPPQSIHNVKVTKIKDYKLLEEKCLLTNAVSKMNFPASNVLQFYLEDGSTIFVRPSGTEPKIKFYFSVNTHLLNRNDFDKITVLLDEKIDGIIGEVAYGKLDCQKWRHS